MMPTLPSTAAPTTTPGSTATNTASGAEGAGDFLTMLGQTAQQPVQSTLASLAVANGWQALSEDEVGEGAPLDALGMMPLSLPLMPAGAHGDLALLQQGAVAGAQILGNRSAVASRDLQLLTDMIESEQAISQDSADVIEGLRMQPTTESISGKPTVAPQDSLSRPVHVPVGSQAWADELGARLTMMAERGRSTASLRMSPEHLGPLEIRIAVRDDQASVWFGAAHADTRAAIEHALPRLRELFESQGMSLTDAGVYEQAPRGQSAETQRSVDAHESPATAEELARAVQLNVGLLDAYA